MIDDLDFSVQFSILNYTWLVYVCFSKFRRWLQEAGGISSTTPFQDEMWWSPLRALSGCANWSDLFPKMRQLVANLSWSVAVGYSPFACLLSLHRTKQRNVETFQTCFGRRLHRLSEQTAPKSLCRKSGINMERKVGCAKRDHRITCNTPTSWVWDHHISSWGCVGSHSFRPGKARVLCCTAMLSPAHGFLASHTPG